jgi:DMSO/TMAO reductase YedYZ molybdopterin-dependent catalytic subunit
METQDVSRRTLLKGGSAAIAGLTVLRVAGPAHAFPGHSGAEVIPWLDQPPPNPVPDAVFNLLVWEELDSWLTPADDFFVVTHYGIPDLKAEDWRLDISGLVAHPRSLGLAELKARPRREVTFTLECSGNTGLPFFIGGIGNARWAGTPLAAVLRQAGPLEQAGEVVFWGADSGEVAIRDNSGVLRGGRTGTVEPDGEGGLDLTITEHFARSMSLAEALNPDNLLCYEMNGVPLPREHGFPVRLIAPGWYGVANVKWLTRIEVLDHPFRGRFTARDYVTFREELRDGETVWTFTMVTHDRLKSAPAKVTRRDGTYAILGAAWGAPIARVEVQIDGGPWRPAKLDRQPSRRRRSREFAWTFWRLRWGTPAAGVHTVRSRAIDVDGNVQPAPEDPSIANKVTFWESNGQITRQIRIP